ncbi:Ankyrin repeat-containing protein BDA1 [Camellia lanceoleosa]|uniref:Ankyrin repeat-containing protein BDA1 n=1 Tax=Camellia lanceoleosa TaxID=1840588 RepID=A0ACC0FM17_9ERIC|nr:Ankyrin repeat-containing protein BDA1 [Camellia lanceoleosa]
MIHEETTLHIVVKSSSPKAVEVLLGWLRKNYKSELLCLTNEGGNTMLHMAVSTSQPEIVKLLVKEIYKDKNAKNLKKQTALDIAATLPNGEAKIEMEKTLRHAGALRRSSLVSDLGEFLKSPRQWFQALIGQTIHARKEMSMDIRNMILFAVLIAIATFQALLQPPGGVMRDNNTPSPPSNTTHVYINGTITTINFISTNMTYFNATIFTNNTDTGTNTDNRVEIIGALISLQVFKGFLIKGLWQFNKKQDFTKVI